MTRNNTNSSNQTVQTVLIVIVVALLAALITTVLLKKSNSSSPLSLTEVNINGETDKEVADRIARDAASLVNSLSVKDKALANAVNERDAALSQREGMTNQLFDYKQKIQELEAKAGEHGNLLNKVNELHLTNERLIKQNSAYLTELRDLRDNDQSAILKQQNARLEAEVATLSAEIEILNTKLNNQQLANADANAIEDELLAYQKENANLKKRLATLKQKLNRSRLFVKEIKSLNPRASSLYNALAKMKGLSGEALENAYIQTQESLSVRKIRHVKFEEGSSYVSDLESNLINHDMETANEKSFLLVVGYASTTGSADANYELSAQRATATATSVYDSKRTGQDVKAVFLGQTDRFGVAPAENQVCEIWEVLPL